MRYRSGSVMMRSDFEKQIENVSPFEGLYVVLILIACMLIAAGLFSGGMVLIGMLTV